MKEVSLNYCDETIVLKKQIEVTFLSLGERLLNIRDNRMFMPQWETFDLFLMDADISSGTASKLINIYQKFHVRFGFSVPELVGAGGWSKLAPLLPVCSTREEAEVWILDKLPVLSRQDAEKEMKEAKTGILMAECNHQDSFIIKVCRTCGDKERVYEEESSS